MSWQSLNLASPTYASQPEPPSMCGLLYRRRRHLFSGPPEANKTLAALIIGLELLRQGETFAIIDFESGPHATRLMLTELGATLEEIGRIIYLEADGPPDADDLALLNGASLAIIDAIAGAYEASGLDDEKRKDAETFGKQWVDPLWKAGIATLLIDHVVKNKNNRGKWAIGSERKAGRADVHLGLDAVVQITRGKHGLVTFTTHKDRPGWLTRPRAIELALNSDPVTHTITWSFQQANATATAIGGGWRPTVLMQRVSEYLERQTDEVTVGSIYRAVKGKHDYVIEAVEFLIEDGFATESQGVRNARMLRSKQPYREVESSPVVPESSPFEKPRVVPRAVPSEGLEQAESESSPSRPPVVPFDCAPVVPSVPFPIGDRKGTGQHGNGEIDEEEVERLAAVARSFEPRDTSAREGLS